MSNPNSSLSRGEKREDFPPHEKTKKKTKKKKKKKRFALLCPVLNPSVIYSSIDSSVSRIHSSLCYKVFFSLAARSGYLSELFCPSVNTTVRRIDFIGSFTHRTGSASSSLKHVNTGTETPRPGLQTPAIGPTDWNFRRPDGIEHHALARGNVRPGGYALGRRDV